MAKKPKSEKLIPTTKTARAGLVAKMTASAAMTRMASEIESLFMPQREREILRGLAREEAAEKIFEGLVQLRGTALKLAQLFCADTGLLPDEYLKKLESAHYQVPALSSAMIRSVLRREMGTEFLTKFSDFEMEAAGAASLGQVHKAILNSGEKVAVKIQYPGVQESLKNDIRLARMSLKPALKTKLILSVLEQLEERLAEEVDYRKEAENLKWYISQKFPVPVVSPKPFPDMTTSRVLTMTWMDGMTLDSWLKTSPSQERRNLLAQSMFDLFVFSVFRLHRFHSDPNLGNFLVDAEDRLVVLDFGSLTQLNKEDVAFYGSLWSSKVNAEELIACYRTRGADVEGDFFEVAVRPYRDWFATFRAESRFDFGLKPEFIKAGFGIFSSQMFNSKLQNYSDGLTLVHRTLLGLFQAFTKMRAQVRFEARHQDWMRS